MFTLVNYFKNLLPEVEPEVEPEVKTCNNSELQELYEHRYPFGSPEQDKINETLDHLKSIIPSMLSYAQASYLKGGETSITNSYFSLHRLILNDLQNIIDPIVREYGYYSEVNEHHHKFEHWKYYITFKPLMQLADKFP